MIQTKTTEQFGDDGVFGVSVEALEASADNPNRIYATRLFKKFPLEKQDSQEVRLFVRDARDVAIRNFMKKHYVSVSTCCDAPVKTMHAGDESHDACEECGHGCSTTERMGD